MDDFSHLSDEELDVIAGQSKKSADDFSHLSDEELEAIAGQSQSQSVAPKHQENPDLIHRARDWANTPAEADLSDLPQSGKGLSFGDKVSAGASALGRGLSASAQNMLVKPFVGGVTDLMIRASGEPPVLTEDNPNGALSPDALGVLMGASGVPRGLNGLKKTDGYFPSKPDGTPPHPPVKPDFRPYPAQPEFENPLNATGIMNEQGVQARMTDNINEFPAMAERPQRVPVESVYSKPVAVPKFVEDLINKKPDNDANVIPKATVENIVEKTAPKTSAEGRAAASSTYKAANESGGILSPDFSNRFVNEAQSLLPKDKKVAGMSVYKPLRDVVDDINQFGNEPMTLERAQAIDEALGNYIDKYTEFGKVKKEGKGILDLQNKFRNMIENANYGDVVDGKDGFALLKQARQDWAKSIRMRDLERIVENSKDAKNPRTAIVSGLRTLRKNENRYRGYSKEEKLAVDKAIKTGAVDALLEMAGSRIVPYIVGGVGLATHGAAAIPAVMAEYAISGAARNVADKRRIGRANKAIETVANRGIAKEKKSTSDGGLGKAALRTAIPSITINQYTPPQTEDKANPYKSRK